MPLVGHFIKVALIVMSFGEAKARYTHEGVHMMAKEALVAKKNKPLKIVWTLMWVDLVLAGIGRKIDGKSKAYLLELWQ